MEVISAVRNAKPVSIPYQKEFRATVRVLVCSGGVLVISPGNVLGAKKLLGKAASCRYENRLQRASQH